MKKLRRLIETLTSFKTWDRIECFLGSIAAGIVLTMAIASALIMMSGSSVWLGHSYQALPYILVVEAVLLPITLLATILKHVIGVAKGES